MTKTKIFDAFGVYYRTVQFPAVGSFEMMGRLDDMSPLDVLRRTSVKDGEAWIPLDTREAINERVVDMAYLLPPVIVLRGLVRLVRDFSFGFAKGWKGVSIPSRFRSSTEPKSSHHVDPIIAHILQEGMASLRELEEYYSMEDAFKMFDVITVKGVNVALSHEAAIKGKR